MNPLNQLHWRRLAKNIGRANKYLGGAKGDKK